MTTTEPVPVESASFAGQSSFLSIAQITTALLAAPNNIPVNSSTIVTVELNGSSIRTNESASKTMSSSDSNTMIAVGVGSFAAALGVAGAIAFAIFLKRRKPKKGDYSKNENVSVSAFPYHTKPAGRDSPAYTVDNSAYGQGFAAAEHSGSVNVTNDSVSHPFSVQSSTMFAATTSVPSHRISMAPPLHAS
ncbi:hypothetical protein BC829DRAFT_204583 [Chytridium lagenaria]|nr:hypothetical protein BC829DRAFT_204583 [Chytridium lagenaria]